MVGEEEMNTIVSAVKKLLLHFESSSAIHVTSFSLSFDGETLQNYLAASGFSRRNLKALCMKCHKFKQSFSCYILNSK